VSLRLIPADSLSSTTAQTGGMLRSAAISGDLVGAREENPSPDTEAVVVIAPSTQEAIVVNVPSL
jgi:hypothetical protein